jgi:DNA-binding MarR family transcriptional regulator
MMSPNDELRQHPSAKRILKRIGELEPYAEIEKSDADGEVTRWVFIHRKHWANDLVVSTRTISRSLEMLETLGLIERQQAFQSRGYGREVHVRLTPKGREAAEQLGSSKQPARQDKAASTTTVSCQHDSSKLTPWQHINKLEGTRDTELHEEKEILRHSPGGDCHLRKEKERGRRRESETDGEDQTVEAHLETMFRRCFKAAFPGFRAQTATQLSLQPISDLAQEVRAGEWTLSEIEETWSRAFPVWWRFVTDMAVRTYDRQRPDRFGAVTYLSEMHNYLLDHARMLKEEVASGPLAPSALRREVISAFEETGGVRNLVFRDPDDASRQLDAMAEYLRSYAVTSEEGIRFIVRLACQFGQAGREGNKYWTPDYENIGRNVRAYLTEASEVRSEPPVKKWAGGCMREFADRVSPHLVLKEHVDELLNTEMDEAARVATCIALGKGKGKGDPIKLFKEAFCVGVEVPG